MKQNNEAFQKQQKLIIDNMALVTYCIKRWIYIGDDEFDDLFQEGCIGLILAARRFDESLGNTFSTYAIRMITGTIKRYKREKSNRYRGLKVSRSIIDNIQKINKIMEENFTDRLTAELIYESGLTEKQAQEAYVTFISKDQNVSISDEDTINIEDTLADKDNYESIISEDTVRVIIEEVRKRLSDRDFDIFEEIYYTREIGNEKISQHELSLKYGISQTQVSRIIRGIRAVLRDVQKKIDK